MSLFQLQFRFCKTNSIDWLIRWASLSKNEHPLLKKVWGLQRLQKAFSIKMRSGTSFESLLKKVDGVGTEERQQDNDRPRTVRTGNNNTVLHKLICNQDDKTKVYNGSRKIP